MPKRIGITIGLGYEGTKVSALKGTVNDSINMSRALTSKYGYDITNINDKTYPPGNARYPSKTNIIFWLNKVLREAQNGDEIFIGYAGHGVQLQFSNSNTEELDGRDEAIIPADYDFKDRSAITDDEIQAILAKHLNSKPNCKVFMLFDCCHSGTMADLRYTFNYHHAKRDFTSYDANKSNSFKSRVVLLSGCRDDQVSWGDLIGLGGGAKARQGVMTSAFLHVIGRNPNALANVFEIVREMYQYTSPYKQQPQISSNYDLSNSRNAHLRRIVDYEQDDIAVQPTPTQTAPPIQNKPTVSNPPAAKPTVSKPVNKPVISKPVVTKPSAPVRPTQPVSQPTQKPVFQSSSSTSVRPNSVRPNSVRPTLSALLNKYAYGNRYRYRNRYQQQSNNYRYNHYRKRDANDSDSNKHNNQGRVNYRVNDDGLNLRSKSSIPKLGDIVGMTL